MSFWQKMIDKFQNQPNGSGPKLSRKKIWCLVGLVVIGILLVVMGSSGNQQEAKKESASALNNPAASLNLKADSMMSREEKDIATTLQDMLSGIEGAGRVKVTVKLASSSKEEYAINTDVYKRQEIWECTRETKEKDLALYTQHCDFIFHLAGVNRSQEEKEFIQGNYDFTAKLLTLLKTYQNKAPILLSSSIQASLDNPYGRSKKAGEDLLLTHEQETGAKVWVYRLPNVFGKWCKPNYNSAVATFCHHIARDLPITVHDPEVLLQLVYIDDVVDEFIQALTGQGHQDGMYCFVPTVHRIKLGDIVDLLHHFKESRQTLGVPQLSNAFTKVLYLSLIHI